MDGEANKAALSRVSANPQAFQEFGAVYVIGLADMDICKVGFSVNPAKRITTLQTALWGEVQCHALLWAPSTVAHGIEHKALKAAREHNVRLKGEWVMLPPSEAVGLVLSAMVGTEAFVDSGTFIEVWAPPKEQLYRRGGKLGIELRKEAAMTSQDHVDLARWFNVS